MEISQKEMDALTTELKRIGDDVKKAGEDAIKEAKRAGDMSTETKTKVDELFVKQGELQARLQEVEQKADRRGREQEIEVKSPGAQMVESEEYKAFAKAGLRSAQSAFVFPLKAITSATSGTGAAGAGIAPDRQSTIVVPNQRRMTVRDLISPGTTESNLIQYIKETGFANAAAIVAEGALKPETTITYAAVNAPVATIAHWVKASKQILADFKQLQSNIDERLRYGLAFAEEAQLLKGSGVGDNLNGIYTQATAYSAPITITSPTKIDVLRLMMLQAQLAEYPATGIVLHPSDWAAIELTKDSTGAYIFANPQQLASPTLWGLPVVATQAMTVDTALVGAFRLGAQVFDREEANVVISSENQDDFIRNMVTIRAEERLGLAVYRPEAFIKNTDLPST